MRKKAFIRRLLLFSLLGIILAWTTLVWVISRDLPDISRLNRFDPYPSTEIFADNGKLIGRVYIGNRKFFPSSEIPEQFKKAVVAIEDSRFYRHRGIDPIAVLRAFFVNLRRKRVVEGGSTITQQLARTLFLSSKPSLKRKLKEGLLATQIEKRFSKDEILTLYCNHVYFGEGAYGIHSASEAYFGKEPGDLDLAESALLAGLLQAPTAYSPFRDSAGAKARQRIVLSRMLKLGYISGEERESAVNEHLRFASLDRGEETARYPYFAYFTTFVVQKLLEKYSPDLIYKGGLKVYTTVDLREQEIAERAIKQALDSRTAQALNVYQGALVAADPKTGFIKAMIGGYEFSRKDQFNRAWQARRQPGSAFKIFVYAAALERGLKPSTLVDDSSVSFSSGHDTWSPKNDDGKFWGRMSLKDAFVWSRNVVAVKVASKLGIKRVIEEARRMGVEEPLAPYLSTALGASVISPLEMLAGTATIANGGVRVNLTPIKMIVDQHGKKLEDHTHSPGRRAISAEASNELAQMMEEVIQRGTGTRANFGLPAAGKTGTTTDFRDAWFLGFTHELACVVWTGNDDSSPMREAYGGYLPAMTWGNFMRLSLSRSTAEFPWQ